MLKDNLSKTNKNKIVLQYYICSGISTNDVSIKKSLVFNDNELIVRAEGRIEVLDRQCVNGKNDPMLDGIQISFVVLQFTLINVLTAKSS